MSANLAWGTRFEDAYGYQVWELFDMSASPRPALVGFVRRRRVGSRWRFELFEPDATCVGSKGTLVEAQNMLRLHCTATRGRQAREAATSGES